MARLDGKVAIITGGARGMGGATSRLFAAEGAKVVIADVLDKEGAALAEELKGSAIFQHHDVSDEASWASVVAKAIATFGQVDILVNNAGIYDRTPIMELQTETFMNVFRTNTLGALWCSQAFIPGMVERQWGRVVMVSSGLGTFSRGMLGHPCYAISKAALNALTIKLAQATPDVVKINAVRPGWVKTRLAGALGKDSVETGAERVVHLALLPDDGPTGGYFRGKRSSRW